MNETPTLPHAPLRSCSLLFLFLPQVELYVNKVGPYYNPQETYCYYSLPVCTPDKVRLWLLLHTHTHILSIFLSIYLFISLFISKVEHCSLTLGEVLDGDRMAVSMYEIHFNVSSPHNELCTRELSNDDIEKLYSWQLRICTTLS